MRTSPTRTIAGRVNADGTPAGGSGFTANRTGAGTYVVTVAGQIIAVTVAPSGSFRAGRVDLTGGGGRSFTVVTEIPNTGAAADAIFHFNAQVAA